MDLKTVADEINSIVASIAILVGGIWAYFKFIRGRTFAHRAELSIVPSVENYDGCPYLSVTITLTNTGLSKLPLNSEMKVIRIFRSVDSSHNSVSATEWDRLLTAPILDQHDWLEAQETVTDTLVYRLGSDGVYQVEALVGAPRRLITRKGTRWQSRAIVFVAPTSVAKLRNIARRVRLDKNHPSPIETRGS